MTATFNRIADFTLDVTPDELPESTRDAAALMLLDTLGITIGSGPMEAGVIARDTAALLYGSSDPNVTARMMFDGRPVNSSSRASQAPRSIGGPSETSGIGCDSRVTSQVGFTVSTAAPVATNSSRKTEDTGRTTTLPR